MSSTNNYLPNFKCYIQPDSISCGPTCASMVLNWYGRNVGIGSCKTSCRTRWFEMFDLKVGMTLPSGLNNCMDSNGIPAGTLTGNLDNVVDYISKERPPMLLVRSGVKYWHWVVVTGYSHKGAFFRLHDPGPGSEVWTITRSTLNGAWSYSTDLNGDDCGGRRCSSCGGSGKLASAKKFGLGGFGSCLICGGSGKSPDMYRKLVESAGAKGYTMVVPSHGANVKQVHYTIWNDSGRTVEFTMEPSGKHHKVNAGRTFEGTSNNINNHSPTLTVTSTGRTYKITAGKHKFWWRTAEKRIAFDANYTT